MTGFAIHRSIRLTQGKVAWVDQADYEMLRHWSWHFNTGYAIAGCGSRKWYGKMHRLIMLPNPGQDVDHINGDKLDNRRRNLRYCTRAQNVQNQPARRSNTSGLVGVDWHAASRKWRARCGASGIVHVGYFDSPEEAARARDAVIAVMHGDFACLNFPGEVE